jgi:hypothetical protein
MLQNESLLSFSTPVMNVKFCMLTNVPICNVNRQEYAGTGVLEWEQSVTHPFAEIIN